MTSELLSILKELDAQLEPVGVDRFRVALTIPRDSLVIFYGAVSAEMRKLDAELSAQPKAREILGDMLKMLGDKIGIMR